MWPDRANSGRTSPIVKMGSTTFRTYSLPLTGAGAITITPAARVFQRAVIVQSAGVAPVFISASAAELNIPGAAAPGSGFQLPGVIGGDPLVIVVAPGQKLVAAAAVAGARLSVSVSETIPQPEGPVPADAGRQPTTFRTYSLPIAGTQAIRIAPSASVPQRVVVRVNLRTAFIGSDAGDLNIAGQVAPGMAFALLGGVNLFSATFITAPGQPLVAVGAAGGELLSVSVSDILVGSLRGPTGIPGPDGQE